MMRRSHGAGPILAAGLLLILGLPPALVAQVSQVAVGQSVRGSIGSDDQRMADGHGYDVYAFTAEAGATVTATLRSPEFDAYLVLARSSGVITEEIAADDDGAGGTDARVVQTITAPGDYLLIVRGLEADAAGEYTLELGTVTRAEPTVTAIRPGEVRVGELDPADDFTADLAYYEVFTFQGRSGDRVAASVRSSQFDSYVDLGTWDGATLSTLASNDDGFEDGTTDARVVVTLPEDGTYAIRATSLEGQRTGEFTVALENLPPAPEPTLGSIRAGETLVGELVAGDSEMDDGSYVDLYTYSGTPGEAIVVTLRSSEFDAFLSVGDPAGPAGFGELSADDDGAGGTDSEVTVAVPASGVLVIRANALSAGEGGGYTLTVRRGGS